MNIKKKQQPLREITYFLNRVTIISCPCRKCVRETVIERFAGPYDRGEFSPSVQKTLYETQVLVLDRVPEVRPHFHHDISELHIIYINIL